VPLPKIFPYEAAALWGGGGKKEIFLSIKHVLVDLYAV